MAKTQPERTADYRASLKQKGLKWFTAIVPEKHATRLRDEIAKLREEHLNSLKND